MNTARQVQKTGVAKYMHCLSVCGGGKGGGNQGLQGTQPLDPQIFFFWKHALFGKKRGRAFLGAVTRVELPVWAVVSRWQKSWTNDSLWWDQNKKYKRRLAWPGFSLIEQFWRKQWFSQDGYLDSHGPNSPLCSTSISKMQKRFP